MIISDQTIAILKNFATINTNILFRKGQLVSTISTNKSIFARAKVSETFQTEFGVYDLNSLLSLLTLMDNQDVTFGEKSLLIRKDKGKFEYFYSSPSILVVAPDKDITFDSEFKFELADTEVNLLMKAASVVSATHLTIEANGSIAELVVGDKKNATANSYTKELSETDKTFSCHISMSNFIVLPDSYDCTLSKKKLLHMKGKTKGVEYFIAMEPSSVI